MTLERAFDASEARNESLDNAPGRLRALVDTEFEFVWQSVRRLGVREGDADDATQKVFLVAADKLGLIEFGRERSFLFGTAMRVASHARRAYRKRREDPDVDLAALEASQPAAEDLIDQVRARQIVDRLLDDMPTELRAVLVLYEVQEMSTPEIAALLEIPLGTAASRLRRAREEFRQRVEAFHGEGVSKEAGHE